MESLTIDNRPPACLGRKQAVLLMLVLWALATLLQVRNDVFTSDVGADPDEPAHVVTSLMMRDYLTTGLLHGEHPMHFAQSYYDHFPKVAIGHYPPGFYVAAGIWLLPWASNTALLLFMGLLAALLGTVTAAQAVRSGLKPCVSMVTGAWVVLLPLTQKQTMVVMSDTLLAVGCLLAIGAFASFLDKPTAGRALLFGLYAAATILTKASGVALALIPVAGIVLLGRWSLLWNWRLWLAPLPVLATALPWTLMTMHITEEGMQKKSVAEYFPEALRFYVEAAAYTYGPLILLGALVALVFAVRAWWGKGAGTNSLAALLTAWVPCLLLLYLVSPTGTSARYFLPLTPPILMGAAWSASQLQRLWSHRGAAVLGCLVVAVASILMLEPVPPKNTRGFGLIAGELTRRAPHGGRVLVSSDARGEGSLVAELALQSNHRVDSSWTVVRASKFAASSSWTGGGYQLAYPDVARLSAAIVKDGIDWVVVDRDVPSYYLAPHHDQMKQWSAGHTPMLEDKVTRYLELSSGVLALYGNDMKP